MTRPLLRPLVALLSALLAACASQACASHEPRGARDDVWVPLFDGTSTDAWRGYRSQTLPAGWQIVDGALTRVEPAGDIVTKRTFGSFILDFEWRISPGGNSGVFFHVTEEGDAAYFSGPEYQILDDEAHGDGLDPRTSAGANYALHAPPTGYTKPVGTWNTGRISVLGGEVQHWLNDHLVVQYELGSKEWKRLVANSKFAAWPQYGRAGRGRIALQDHGDRVQFRSIRILPLD